MPSMIKSTSIVAASQIERAILHLRGEKAILVQLYGVETRALVQAVKRNVEVSRRISCFT